jgi:hypothetical protein
MAMVLSWTLGSLSELLLKLAEGRLSIRSSILLWRLVFGLHSNCGQVEDKMKAM